MRLLDRYLLRELLAVFAYCFGGFLLLWIAADLIAELQNLMEKGLGAGDIAAFYFFRLPEFLPVALPVSLLLASLYALTNHARHNEITAIRANGVSLGRLSAPYFAVGCFLTVALFAANEFWAPGAADRAEQIAEGRGKRIPEEQRLNFVNSRTGEHRIWHASVYNPRTSTMTNVVVNGSDFEITAARAVWTNGEWMFFDARQTVIGANGLRRSFVETNELAKPDFSETPEEIESEISVTAHFNLDPHRRTRRADVPLAVIWNYLRLHPNPNHRVGAYVYTQLHGRFAGPCACLVVILIAVPFAAGSGRRNVFVGVAASIFIFFAYFLVQQLGLAFGEAGRMPAWLGAWLPNLIFGASGFWLMATIR